MPTFKITLAYDGTGLVGWQRQASGTSVQGLLEDVLCKLDGCAVTVIGAGRTDAGVHALAQAAGFSIERQIASDALVRALNAGLPPEVRVLDAVEVPPAFHPRFGARTKVYRYRIWNAQIMSPFERQYAWHVPGALDSRQMAAAAKVVEGRHDFAAFQAAGSAVGTTDRMVLSSRIDVNRPVPGGMFAPEPAQDARGGEGLIAYEICGTGFLRHMVRNIVGTLVEIGRGRRTVEWMASVLASRDRAQAGPTAPPEGLFLVSVDYDDAALAAKR